MEIIRSAGVIENVERASVALRKRVLDKMCELLEARTIGEPPVELTRDSLDGALLVGCDFDQHLDFVFDVDVRRFAGLEPDIEVQLISYAQDLAHRAAEDVDPSDLLGKTFVLNDVFPNYIHLVTKEEKLGMDGGGAISFTLREQYIKKSKAAAAV